MNTYRLFLILVLLVNVVTLVVAQTSRAAPDPATSTTSAVRPVDGNEGTLPTTANRSAINDPLVRVLVTKGLLTVDEARLITATGTVVEQRDRLAALLRDKGLISASEFETVRNVSAQSTVAVLPSASEATNKTANDSGPSQTPAAPTKIAAIAPVRLLGIDTPKKEGLIPDIKLGTGARLKLYGIFKTSIIHDSSSPQGNDFPLPLLAGDTGPNSSPEFHLRARGLRLGVNFEWLDPTPNMIITGKIEFDFEGNFHPRQQSQHLFDPFQSALDSFGMGPHRSEIQ